MDATVIPDEPNELHLELAKASEKLDRRDAREETNVGYGATVGGVAITSNYLDHVTQTVIAKLSGPREKKRLNADFNLEVLLRQLDPAVLALCILQTGLHAAGRGGRNAQMDVAMLMGTSINNELWAAKLLQTDLKLFRRIAKKSKERFGSVELRVAFAKREAAKVSETFEGFRMADWDNPLRIHAGNWAMKILLSAMPLVFNLEEPRTFKGEHHWCITEFGMDMAKEAVAEAVVKSPVYQPRTERPKDWDRFTMRVAEDDRTMDRAKLLRTGHKDIMSAAAHAIRTGAMAPTLKAINTLQSVPFKINTWIMDVIVECYNNNITVEGLPSWAKLEVPKKLPLRSSICSQWSNADYWQRPARVDKRQTALTTRT
jgi:DNA-directed RNA polymerase